MADLDAALDRLEALIGAEPAEGVPLPRYAELAHQSAREHGVDPDTLLEAFRLERGDRFSVSFAAPRS